MVIISKLSGQLANRLHFVTYFIANSKAHNYQLIVTCFPEFHALFEPQVQSFPAIILGNSIIQKIINRLINKSKSILCKLHIDIPRVVFHSIPESDNALNPFNINDEAFINLAKSKIVLPEGWLYRDFKHLKEFKKDLAAFFSPKPQFKIQVQTDINKAKSLGSTLVGIHIRRTDYKDFNNGRWYYPNQLYLSKMLEINQILPHCTFILCSDEQLDVNDFQELNVVYTPRPAIVDLYLLAACNFIMGPPSTFSSWASFVGDVPAYYIDDPSITITMDLFKDFIQ
ncbi:glycosyl transferase family 11 [Mucilaginibacter yixingensis]|uniref:Glycosyl transferase family 11 n=1 Tax=Mucilaginibacter yixingensis TaxID=1295612 RepID=A0A2T5J8M2_9SPHI|nr:alpha-1,2-fucosyltransferase [Mucilaginibacter yixingensis]PTQ95813.1 glycosyl transferase family 11 [Mucilaginibacter yixingensis]